MSDQTVEKRQIVLSTFPCIDGTWGVGYWQNGIVESTGHATQEDAEQYILNKKPGRAAVFVLFER